MPPIQCWNTFVFLLVLLGKLIVIMAAVAVELQLRYLRDNKSETSGLSTPLGAHRKWATTDRKQAAPGHSIEFQFPYKSERFSTEGHFSTLSGRVAWIAKRLPCLNFYDKIDPQTYHYLREELHIKGEIEFALLSAVSSRDGCG